MCQALLDVAIGQEAEVVSEFADLIDVDLYDGHAFLYRCLMHHLSGVVDQLAGAVVVVVHAVHAVAIDGDDVTLVFDGTSGEQLIPRADAAIGETGHVDDDVVFELFIIPHKDGEAHIVTDLQHEAHALVFDDPGFGAGRIMGLFVGIGEEVAFVVIFDLTIGSYGQHSVVKVTVVLDDDGAHDQGIILRRPVLHLMYRRAIHGFGQGGIHGKARGKHLG